MAVIPGVSFLGQSTAQISRLNGLQSAMSDLQRQMTTQKKYDTLSGFGLDAQRVLQFHANHDQLETYNSNIDVALTHMNLMSTSMSQIMTSMRQMTSDLLTQPAGGQYNMTEINSLAQQLLTYVTDVGNISIDGRYLFAGTDAKTEPLSNMATVNSNMQAEMTNWLNGTTTTTQLLINIDGFSGANLGFSTTLSGAQDVNARIDTNLDLTYGARADQSGVQDVVRALSLLANLSQPNPAVDIPTNTEFGTVIDHILLMAQDAVTQMEMSQVTLGSKLTLVKSIRESHAQDINLFQAQIDKAENADMTEVVASLQALQTQISASYEVTRLISQLSLVNFLT